jgi:DNA-binding MarR family transcriptional regulator
MKLSRPRKTRNLPADRPPELVRLVGRFLEHMHRHDAGRTLPLLHAARVTTPQLAVLEFARTPRTISAVADHVGLSRPATSQMIEKLFRRRFIQRSESQRDRREKRVLLSASGIALLDRIHAARLTRFGASLASLPKRTATRLTGALAEAVAAMEAADCPAERLTVETGHLSHVS